MGHTIYSLNKVAMMNVKIPVITYQLLNEWILTSNKFNGFQMTLKISLYDKDTYYSQSTVWDKYLKTWSKKCRLVQAAWLFFYLDHSLNRLKSKPSSIEKSLKKCIYVFTIKWIIVCSVSTQLYYLVDKRPNVASFFQKLKIPHAFLFC